MDVMCYLKCIRIEHETVAVSQYGLLYRSHEFKSTQGQLYGVACFMLLIAKSTSAVNMRCTIYNDKTGKTRMEKYNPP
jgi:hypothetical protein